MEFENRAEISVKVHVKRLEGLPRRIIPKPSKRRWYVALSVGAFEDMKTESQTRSEDGSVTWDKSFTIIMSTQFKSPAKMTIYRAHEYSNDEKAAFAHVVDLVEISHQKECFIDLQGFESAKKDFGQLVISVQVQLPKINLSLAKLDPKSGQLLTEIITIPSASPSWQRFLTAFQQATQLARQVAELDPTAKAAVGVISFALIAVVKQIERDQRVCDLQDIMTSLLVFFRDLDSLQKSPFLRNVLNRLLCQVSECTYFILQYQEIESFVQRSAIHLASDTDALLNQFFTVFSTLKAELALGTSLQAAINTEYILNKVNEIDAFLHIHRLKHFEESGWRSDQQCAPKTRDFTLTRIQKWVSSCDQGLFVLVGPSGSGKSAILHTVASALDERKRLGAGIFLSEETKGEKTAKLLMRTLVYYLALSNPRLGKRIAGEIAQHPSLDSADANRYGELLIDISRDLVLYGPLAIIIDGIHELETPQEREVVQAILSKVARRCHCQLRFVISSQDWSLSTKYDQISVRWDIDRLEAAPTDDYTAIHSGFDDLSRQDLLGGYTLRELTPLIDRHSIRSPIWVSSVHGFLLAEPKLTRAFLDELLSSKSHPTSEEDALNRISAAIRQVLLSVLAVFDNDFIRVAPGSKLFVQQSTSQSNSDSESSYIPNHTIHELGFCTKAEKSRVRYFDEYDIEIPANIDRVLNSSDDTIPPLLPSIDYPLNIYQTCLCEGSAAENRGPVYARFARPVGKPLLDGLEIKGEYLCNQIYFYLITKPTGKGFIGSNASSIRLSKVLKTVPPEGCEWIVLHHELFPLMPRDGYTLILATAITPVLTGTILERLVCIWVYWTSYAVEGTCLRLRNGKEESDFLRRDSSTNVVYYETHAELFCNGERKGDLVPGDQLQVRVTTVSGCYSEKTPFAVVALALRY